MWRAGAAAVTVVLAAVTGVLTALVTAHPSSGLWAALVAAVVIGAVLTGLVAAGERRSRRLPSDSAGIGVIREAAQRIRQQEEAATRDGITWPALPDADAARCAKAINAMGSRALARAWHGYVAAALEHARLFRGGRVPPVRAEFSGRRKSDRAYDRLMVRLRHAEER